MQNLDYNISKKINGEISMSLKIYSLFKRIFDVVSSTLLLITLSPLFLILIILVKLDSKGPVFFGHKRIGYKGEIISVYKFRSMVQNAEEVLRNFTPEQKAEFEKNFKLDDDPRVTKIGAFLRKTSLDELPQLINIIKGDMSVVGPRPIVQKEVVKYGKYADKLFSVKPGLTGFWQANGRSDTTYDERVQMDMYYIDNRSTLLDIKILFKTVIAVIRKEGAI
ncbi:Sugar transferase involved in LPS biosynthesis (colanic, teichoic acid) [Clostridium intestinale DSM 6191]|uniref:Sugar transferase involved in LPS biosynthesis (Colanic, teichoic acid) n=2 Tax=Clostridium intestinale TaxID=36845 RepID=A0A1M6DP46_9CLOT|nr:Sugar transferase involved in LPS biosynthesis (colanic, teichoic acid) [Clostridium intestinale DSM 6191]